MIKLKMNELSIQIRKELLSHSDEKVAKSTQRFFKNDINSLGIKAKMVEYIAKSVYKNDLKGKDKKTIFEISEELMKSEYLEETSIGIQFIVFSSQLYEKEDIHIFEKLINQYITNWATCDSLCNHAVGKILMKFPETIDNLKNWSRSENLWLRRASAVSLIIPARKGLFLNDIIEITSTLLSDKEDMVQKGYGWLLKAASMTESFIKGEEQTKQEHFTTVFNFVLSNKSIMPRTALRYAIEKMPKEVKKQAMEK